MNNLLRKTITHPGQDDDVTYVHTAAETQGEKSELDIVLHPKGAGPPLHYHKAFNEKFEIIEGELKVQIGKTVHSVKAGDVTTAEIGDLHRFWSESDKPVKFKVTIEPGHEGFESTLAITYGLARDGLMTKKGIPKKFSHMAILASMSDTNAPGFFTIIFGLLKYYAKKEKIRNIQTELIKRYCQ